MPPIRYQQALPSFSPYDFTTSPTDATIEEFQKICKIECKESPAMNCDLFLSDPFDMTGLDPTVIANLGLPSPPRLCVPEFYPSFDNYLSGLDPCDPMGLGFGSEIGFSSDPNYSDAAFSDVTGDHATFPHLSPLFSNVSPAMTALSNFSPASNLSDFDLPHSAPSPEFVMFNPLENSLLPPSVIRTTPEELKNLFIGPDQEGKYTCLYKGCQRRFGRRYNIHSHIQTHLSDRPFKCDHCDSCFVRAHDLRRHAKIHDDNKAHLCPCGKGFTRMDALTRHRMRAICTGAMQGFIRKNGRRGRPRKYSKYGDREESSESPSPLPLNTPQSPFDSTFWDIVKQEDNKVFT